MKKTFILISLCLIVFNVSASTLTTVKIRSEEMDKDVSASVILPDSHDIGIRRFPVLYLLHGAGDDHRGWVSRTPVRELADTYGIIIVCPDADKTSWYFDSPIDPKSQYETFVSKELVKYVDSNYRTFACREFRAIAGISMGGHGAMFLAIRHKDVFSTVSCMSGGVDIRPFPNNWGIKDRIGDIKKHPKRWEELTVINVAKTLKDGDLAISIDCGSSDFFIGVNRNLHKHFLDAKISHEYCERPGVHNWNYWKYSIRFQMVFINENFNKARLNAQKDKRFGNNALIAVPKLENDGYDWFKRHENIKEQGQKNNPDIVLIGDSITHYWAGSPKARIARGAQQWNDLFANNSALNMGFGWDRIQNVLWRIDNGAIDDLNPKMFVINIGTNNLSKTKNARASTPDEIAEGISELCTIIQSKHNDAKIILMGIFPRGNGPANPYQARITEINNKLKKLDKTGNIHFLDIGQQFLNDDGKIDKSLMPDFCHPSAKGYAIWARALKEKIAVLK